MKQYKIYFTDYTETTGTAPNKAEMMKQARRYIRAWNLDIKVDRIEEMKGEKALEYGI